MKNKLWWWEKTVEYAFVRHIMSDHANASPLDGKPEKWLGDLIESKQGNFRLIEFKREVDSIKSENKKYANKEKCYLDSCQDITNREKAAHWLVFGEAYASADTRKQLKLKYRHYHKTEDADLTSSNDLSYMKYESFMPYIKELMELRGEDGTAQGGGLVMASVKENQVSVLDLSEVIQMVPELAENFSSSPVNSSHNRP